MADLMVAIDESHKQIPNLELAQKIYYFESQQKLGQDTTELKSSIIEDIEESNMLPVYNTLCNKFGWDLDETKVENMRINNEKRMQEWEIKHEDVIQNAGDMEVLDSLFAKARYYSKIGSWEESLSAYDVILKKEKTSTGKKIDATMEMARIELFRMNFPKLKDLITESKRLIELGGDWDRRNRLKVYEALYLVAIRDFRKASTLFLDCIATFTCVELCSYKQFMFYALLTSIMSISRNDLRKNIIDNPHVISIIRELPEIQALLKSIYNCEYNLFFQALLSVYPNVIKDRYLGSHCSYLVREYRILAYSQFLEAYKSVMMSSMALSFGMTLNLLDEELSRFISAGRLNAKIDKVGDVIETSRPDKKNSQYQEVIKKGDILLNHIQKLVRVIDV